MPEFQGEQGSPEHFVHELGGKCPLCDSGLTIKGVEVACQNRFCEFVVVVTGRKT